MTNTAEQIKIPLNKKKLTLMLMGSIGFVFIGLGLVIYSPTTSHLFLVNQTLIFLIALASILFFGLCFFYIAIYFQ